MAAGKISEPVSKEERSFRRQSYPLWEPWPMDESIRLRYLFRNIRSEEADQAALIEAVCFSPEEACSAAMMRERVRLAPELMLSAVDKETGKLAGFLSGLSTNEQRFRDEFFSDASLQDANGSTILLVGLDVLPAHRGQGLARELMNTYLTRERENGRKLVLLTCADEKIKMYEKMGFVDEGISDSVWGGHPWHEMACILNR